jgi:glycerate dehydrogenase
MNIVFLDRDTLGPHTRLRALGFPHRLVAYGHTAAHEVGERIADADIVIVNKVRLDALAIERVPRLRCIAVAAIGTDNVDLQACRQRGIVVSNVRNYAVHTVPEHTFALIFALRRSICAYRDAVRAGRWQRSGQFCFFDHPIRDLAGSTLGVIGDGVLGQAVAAMGRALGMRVWMSSFKGRHDQDALYTPFDKVLAEADVLTLHCPLTADTRHMIDAARGGRVAEAAVGPALDAGQISGAAFDVATPEPPSPDHPLMALVDRPLHPHAARRLGQPGGRAGSG